MRPTVSAVLATVVLLANTAPARGAEPNAAEKRPLNVRDLVMMERVSDPRISPDGKFVAYQVRKTDLEANKGVNGIWLVDLKTPGAAPRMLSAPGSDANTPRWSA